MPKEITFAREFAASCKELKIAYWKIPDSFPPADRSQMRFIPPKPFDGFMIHKGRPICVEFKMVKKKEAFPFNKVADHQVENLLKAKNALGFGLLIINYRYEYYEHGKDEKILTKKVNVAFIIEIEAFLHWKIVLKDRKSIPFDNMITLDRITRIPNPNGKGRIWDIEKMVNLFTGDPK